jgi:hypothetical protein
MYNNIFAIDEVPFNERLKLTEKAHPYLLNNYSFFGSKLDEELYYNYFLRTCLIDIDIMELEEFFKFQFENSENSEKLRMIIEYKIIPDINKIISNAHVNGRALEYRNEKALDHGFVETDGEIKNKLFDFPILYNHVAINKLEENLKQRKIILSDLINLLNQKSSDYNFNKLNWTGKSAHLALIIQTLVDEGYINPPLGYNKEINKTQLAKQIINSFSSEENLSERNLRKYLSFDDMDGVKLRESFNNNGLHIPNAGVIG